MGWVALSNRDGELCAVRSKTGNHKLAGNDAGADIMVRTGAVVNVSHTLFDATGAGDGALGGSATPKLWAFGNHQSK